MPDPRGRAALLAWADLDRFEVPEVPLSTEEGWAAVGEIVRGQKPEPWPPHPEKSPEKVDKSVLVTRVMFGCVPVADLEDLLDRLFPDDQRFVQTGIRPTRARASAAASAHSARTCRGSFLLDAAGLAIPDSLSYSPLIDFARHVERHMQGDMDQQRAVTYALKTIDEREEKYRSEWDKVADSGSDREPPELVLQLLRAVSTQLDEFRYVTQWVPTGQQPEGQLPAFFRDDLLAAAGSATSRLVCRYLTGRPAGRPEVTMDVAGRHVLAALVRPSRMPRAAWPGKNLPRLSQQIALSAVLGPGADPLMSVNGPPGTGKTTLLRDLYANVVTERAKVMVGYADPTTAFGTRREVPSGSQRTWALYAPRPELCGFEMLVASSNNAAVENVSRELPALSGVAPDLAHRVTYFRSATEAELAPPDLKPAASQKVRSDASYKLKVIRPGLLPDGSPAGGMAAAVLGSRGRVSAFSAVVDRYNKGAGRTSLLAQLSAGAAHAQWTAAQQRFQQAQRAVEQRVSDMGQAAAGIDSVEQLAADERAGQRAVADAQVVLARCRAATIRAEEAVNAQEGPGATADLALAQLGERRPAALSRWMQTAAAKAWSAHMEAAEQAAAEAQRELDARRGLLQTRLVEEREAHSVIQSGEVTLRRTQALLQQVQGAIAACPNRLDDHWWRFDPDPGRPDPRQLAPVWVDEELQRKRAELFAAAMQVHEVFARRAGRQMAANLRTWMALQTNEVEATVAREVTLPAWQAFFLLVPLASTTFASMARLMQSVPTGSLRWLIVDEAGQAVPAAAVGGLARFQRALVVGDPKQLEPVVTLPDALVAELMRHHDAPADLAPNRASVQTLTDSVSRIGTARVGEWIGLPLLVHNRCLDPMYSVANEIAYSGEMIHGRGDIMVEHVLGDSRWIDVPRPDGAHFRTEDLNEVLNLLRTLDWSQDQSIAIISPFKEVVRGLRRPIEREVLTLLPSERQSKEQRDVAVESVRVGTVHTFQGREKVAVILVLGGGSAGARQWAARSPNLLNVAVTRAQDRLYVIGDRGKWQLAGHARTLDQHLPPT